MLEAILFVTTLALSTSAPSPSTLFIQPCNFGDAYQFEKVQCQIEFENRGNRPIKLSDFTAGRPTDSVSKTEIVVPARGIAHLNARVSLQNEDGLSKFYFRFATDEPGQTHRSAEVRGFVDSVLDQVSPVLDFAIVDLSKPLPKLSLTLSSRAIEDFQITNVLSHPAYVDVEIGDDKRSLEVAFKKGAPLGINQSDFLKLAVNTPMQRQIWVGLKSNVQGDVVPASNPFALGLMRTNNVNEFLIRLESKSGKPVNPGKVEVERFKANTSILPCIPNASSCKLLQLRVDSDQPTGQVGGRVNVDLPDANEVLHISVWGMLLTPDVKVLDYNEEAKKAESVRGESVAAEPAIDIKNALKLAVKDAELPVVPGRGPLIKWAATNEQFVYGYAVYRSAAEAGPFIRLNSKAVVVEALDGIGSKYQWRDNTAVSGKTYWYYVGILNKDGTKAQLSGAQKVTAR